VTAQLLTSFQVLVNCNNINRFVYAELIFRFVPVTTIGVLIRETVVRNIVILKIIWHKTMQLKIKTKAMWYKTMILESTHKINTRYEIM
jgi:hypothetical protein